MNIKQEGLGHCAKCGTPIMSKVGQSGQGGVCFGCQSANEVKTGRTVTVTEASENIDEKVSITEVKAGTKGAQPMVALTNEIVIRLTIEQLTKDGIVPTLLQSAYDAIDAMPPFATLKDTKQVIKVQEHIEYLMKQKESKNERANV